MIPIGTVLNPRDASDEPVRVVALHDQGEHVYVVAPVEDFGPPEALGFDAISSRYDCSAFSVGISLPSEQESWLKLSSTVVAHKLNDQRQRDAEAERLPSPESVFAKAQAEE